MPGKPGERAPDPAAGAAETPSDLERGRAHHARQEGDDAFQALSRADRAAPLS